MAWGNDVLKIALANPDVIVPAEALDSGKAKRKNKFNAVQCEFDGMKFASKKELARYGELRLLELTGHISDLSVHVPLPLIAGVKYITDFMYTEDGKTIVEDTKGGKATQTPVFRLKWRQAQELYPDYIFRIT